MFKIICIFLLCVVSVNCQTWATRACLVNGNDFFVKTLQETINRIGKDIKWCNLKLVDVTKQIDEHLYKWHALGTANYTNGFLVNFQRTDVTNIHVRLFTSSVTNSTTENRLIATGSLNFRNLNVGYDVEAYMNDIGIRHFTVTFPYTSVTFDFTIQKNIKTNVTSVSTTMGASATARGMAYLPRNNVSDVLSRHLTTVDIIPSFSKWAEDILTPIVREVASKNDVPAIRFDNKC